MMEKSDARAGLDVFAEIDLGSYLDVEVDVVLFQVQAWVQYSNWSALLGDACS